jgi:Ca2+-binding RTX toxin-like protein
VDFLLGNSGNNGLDGRGGIDTMRGGLGDDVYYVDNVADVTDDGTGGGGVLDQVFSTVSYIAAAGIERLTLQGATNINATGRDGQADFLIGNSGNNALDGKSGIDTMRGGLGDDNYYVDNVADVTDEATGGGGIGDYVLTTVSYTSAAGIERIYLLGATNIDATGRDGQTDYLIGNAGNNVLNGKGGNDDLQGGLGLDTYRFDTAPNAATNQDQIIGFSSVDDKIELDNAVFTALGAAVGPLAASMFQIGAAANDVFDRIIYNNATGALSYDADGNTAAGLAAIQFATLAGAPVLALGDLFVI